MKRSVNPVSTLCLLVPGASPSYSAVSGCLRLCMLWWDWQDRWSTELSKDDDDKIIATILDWGSESPGMHIR